MSMKEIAREPNRSWLTSELVSGDGVGSGLWGLCQISRLTILRGFRYWVILEQPTDPRTDAQEIGFLQSDDVDLKAEFGKDDFEYGEGEIRDAERFARICGPI